MRKGVDGIVEIERERERERERELLMTIVRFIF